MKRSRFRFYLKISAAAFAVIVTVAILWFIFRVEKYILSRLPKEITAEKLSVSFLNQAFVLTRARVSGRAGTQCEGREILEIAEATGKFNLKQRQLSEIALKGVIVKSDALRRGCFIRPGEKPEIRFSETIAPEGLAVVVTDAKFPVPEFGEFAAQFSLHFRETGPGTVNLNVSKFAAGNGRIDIQTKKVILDLRKSSEAVSVSGGQIMGTLKVRHLEKIPRLATKKLTVLAGEGEVQFSADILKGVWTLYTNVNLKKMKLRGEPFVRMPMGLLQMTPENMWPMVEDAPGLFSFSFKTTSEQPKLAKTYAADFRNALTRKVKGNLKKKIPILPF